MTFLEFIGSCPYRVEHEFPDDVKVISNLLGGNERTIVFQVTDELDNHDIMNAMAARMKATYPLHYIFREQGFDIYDHKRTRIAETNIMVRDETVNSRLLEMAITISHEGQNHPWITGGT